MRNRFGVTFEGAANAARAYRDARVRWARQARDMGAARAATYHISEARGANWRVLAALRGAA